MAHMSWQTVLEPIQIADGTALASSTTLTDISLAPQITLPANLLQVGSKLRMRAQAKFSNTSTPTLLMGFYYGAVAGTALAASSAVTTTTGATNWPIDLFYEGTVRSIGATGTIYGYGYFDLGTALTAFTHRPIPETAAATVTIDTTAAKTLTVGAQWGTNSASNTITCVNFTVELLN